MITKETPTPQETPTPHFIEHQTKPTTVTACKWDGTPECANEIVVEIGNSNAVYYENTKTFEVKVNNSMVALIPTDWVVNTGNRFFVLDNAGFTTMFEETVPAADEGEGEGYKGRESRDDHDTKKHKR